MKNKLKTILCIMVSLLICGTAFAQTKPNPESDFKFVVVNNGSTEICVYIGKSETVVIPSQEPYSYLDNKLFTTSYTKAKIKSVVIPEGVTTLPSEMFKNLESLKSVKLPDSLKEIGENAFEGCKSLTNIVIPNSVITIGRYAFSGCESLTNINIPNSVTKIGNGAFSGCKSLTNINIPNSVTKIGSCAFSECNSLKKIIIPGSVEKIEGELFFDSGLENIVLSDGVKVIGEQAFYGATNLKELIIPSSVTSIGEKAFIKTSIVNLTIPGSVAKISRDLFYDNLEYSLNGVYNESLETVTFLEGVQTIGDSTFYLCKSLKEINLPSTVTKIGANAFANCDNLSKIEFPEGITYIYSSAFEGCNALNKVIIPSSAIIHERAFANCDNLEKVIIKEGVVIGREAFKNCKKLNLVIPESIKYIKDSAFENCESISGDLFISLKSSDYDNVGIGYFAFKNCKNIKSVKIIAQSKKENVSCEISDAFEGCDSIESVEIGFTNIENQIEKDFHVIPIKIGGAFKNLTSLQTAIIGSGVKEIYGTFKNCTNLSDVTLPEDLEGIGGSAFANCTSLKDIEIGNCFIGSSAFKGCTSLKDIDISFSSRIGDSAFEGCTSLKDIDVGNCSIGNSAFKGCTSLKTVSFSQKEQKWQGPNIGSGAFEDCSSLETIIFPQKLNKIGGMAFARCTSLNSIIIPPLSDSEPFGRNAFISCTSLATVSFLETSSDRIFSIFANYDRYIPFNKCNILVINLACSDIEEKTYSLRPKIQKFFPDAQINFNHTPKKIKTNNTEKSSKTGKNKTKSSDKSTSAKDKASTSKNTATTPAKSSSAESKTEVTTDNPFENSTIFTPHITKGEMNITTEPFEYNGQTYTALSISGNTGSQKGDYSDSWEASCKSNEQMKEFIQKGDNISFKALGDGKTWVLYFVLYDDDKATYYSYEFATKKGKVMEFSVPYKKLKFADWSVYRKFKKEEIRTIIFTGNNAGQKSDRSIKIFDVKVF